MNEAVLDAYRQAREKAAQEGKERTSQQMQNGGQEFMQYRGELLPFRQAVTNNYFIGNQYLFLTGVYILAFQKTMHCYGYV